MSSCFINVHYRDSSSILKINYVEKLTYEDICKKVKSHFRISGTIQFHENLTMATVGEDILADYVEKFQTSPGRELRVVDNTTDPLAEDMDISEILCVQINSNTNSNMFNIMNKVILEHLPDTEFKYLKQKYSIEKHFSNHEQIQVSKIVIRHIFDTNLNIELHKKDFTYLAEVICEVFPNEIADIYYTPGTNGQKPMGKVYDAYNNMRKKLSSVGLVFRRQYSVKQSAANTSNSSNAGDESPTN